MAFPRHTPREWLALPENGQRGAAASDQRAPDVPANPVAAGLTAPVVPVTQARMSGLCEGEGMQGNQQRTGTLKVSWDEIQLVNHKFIWT